MDPEKLWSDYCKAKGVDPATGHEAWAFCGGGPMADELLKLVLDGKKFGTASLYQDYIAENEDIPGEREYSIILDSNDNAACVVRNYEVKVSPFFEVSDFHGYSEGEEERNLAAWRRIHEKYWAPDMKRLGIASVADCQVVQEKFSVEYVALEYAASGFRSEELFLIEPNARYSDQTDGSCAEGDVVLWCIRKSDDRLVGAIGISADCGRFDIKVLPSECGKGYDEWMRKKAEDFMVCNFGLESGGKEA